MLLNHPPKAVLISNPHNPLGTIYTNDQLSLLANWCKEKNIHFIVDEIYALSVFPEECMSDANSKSKNPTSFTSIVSVLDNKLGDNVHVLYGISKDFGASGLRMGFMYTQNTKLRKAVATINDAFQVSRLMQLVLADILKDKLFMTNFFRNNAALVYNSFSVLNSCLTSLNVEIVGPAVGTTFVFADFRSFINAWKRNKDTTPVITNTNECNNTDSKYHISKAEDDLFYKEVLCDKLKLFFTPSEPCAVLQRNQLVVGDKEVIKLESVYGYYRICYTWVSLEGIKECCRRLTEEYVSYS